MHWALATFTLLAVAIVCRRLLRLDGTAGVQRGLVRLQREREEIYEPVALEIETQTVILGISLNEALGERQQGNTENAWRLVGLAVCQWNRLAETVAGLLSAIEANIPSAQSALRVRVIDRQRFRSRTMMEFTHFRDALEQLLFRSKVRFQMNIRMLRRAVEALTSDFERAHDAIGRRNDASSESWDLIDPAFYDFDLVIKEALLAFRNLLPALPESALGEFACDLKPVVSRSVRARSAAAAH